MKINMLELKVGDLVQGYFEDDSTGKVGAWNGKLDVRPEYQREFVYREGQRDAVISTVLHGFPLGSMYFVDRGDGTYEVLDGQQRIISLCRYAMNAFSVKLPAATGGFNSVNFPNLFKEQLEAFRGYPLQVYVCQGTEQEKLDWFQVINIAGETLERQEILNALLHSAWLTDAKSLFSRHGCAAHKNFGRYLKGDCLRQKYLETAFRWAADAEEIAGKDAVREYMQKHRHDENADVLWKYFEDVFAWVRKLFGKDVPVPMKGVEWGMLYNQHRTKNFDPAHMQKRTEELLADREVQKRSGVYEYLLEGETLDAERFLNLRRFEQADMAQKWKEQDGRCAACGKPFALDEMEGDHVIPWSRGGRTVPENLQMLCRACNRKKGAE